MRLITTIGLYFTIVSQIMGQAQISPLIDHRGHQGLEITWMDISLDMFHSAASPSASIYESNGSIVLDVNPILSSLESTNFGLLDVEGKTLDLNYRNQNMGFSIFHEFRYVSQCGLF